MHRWRFYSRLTEQKSCRRQIEAQGGRRSSQQSPTDPLSPCKTAAQLRNLPAQSSAWSLTRAAFPVPIWRILQSLLVTDLREPVECLLRNKDWETLLVSLWMPVSTAEKWGVSGWFCDFMYHLRLGKNQPNWLFKHVNVLELQEQHLWAVLL